MKRRSVITALCACLLAAYVFVMVPLTNRAERNDTFKDFRIELNDAENTGFLKKEDVQKILNVKYSGFDTLKRKHLNTLEVEQLLNSNNRVEKSTCRILSDGTLVITVTPLNPVARVFDREGSVYVNAVGKRVVSHPSYHIDVPVVTTSSLADSAMISRFLPVLNAIKSDSRLDALVSSLHIDGRGDIIIIPNIVGHVINFGDSSLIDNKFQRLETFYREIMPVRGWNAFDTVSVKWVGQIVATKRDKALPTKLNFSEMDDIVDEALDDAIMDGNLTVNP